MRTLERSEQSLRSATATSMFGTVMGATYLAVGLVALLVVGLGSRSAAGLGVAAFCLLLGAGMVANGVVRGRPGGQRAR